jgi:hypothetical protein
MMRNRDAMPERVTDVAVLNKGGGGVSSRVHSLDKKLRSSVVTFFMRANAAHNASKTVLLTWLLKVA